MRQTIIYILLLTAILANAQTTLKNDSAFQAQVVAERLQDSTDIDRIKTLYVDALRFKEISKTSGDRELLLKTISNLEESIRLQDSLHIPAPRFYAAASFQLALFHLGTQNHRAAYFYISQAHRYDENNTEYLEYLVYMNENSDDPKLHKKAIKDLEKLRKLKPYNSSYCLHLVNSYSDAGNFKKAFRELDAYRKIEGESMTSLQYEMAILYQSGKEKMIPSAFAGYIARNPQDRQSAEMMLASYYCQTNQYDEAFTLLYHNLDFITNYNLSRLLNPYVATYFERGDTLSAYHLLDTLQTLHPSDITVYQYALEVYQATGDTSAMMNALSHICMLDKRNEEAYSTLFGIYTARHMNDSARIIASQGQRLFQKDEWIYRHIVSLANDTTLSDSLISVCRHAILVAKEPYMKGLAYIYIGDYMMMHDSMQAAFTAYDSCLVYLPDNSHVLNNYAYNLATLPDVTPEELARAEKMAASAMKHEPSSPSVIDTYAWILFLRNDASSARMYYERLIRMIADGKVEEDAIILYHIYRVYQGLGFSDEADRYLEKARVSYRKDPASVRDHEIIDLLK